LNVVCRRFRRAADKARRRELAHVDANFGDHDLRRRPADAGHACQTLDGVAKGRQRGLDPCVEFPNGGFDLFDEARFVLGYVSLLGQISNELVALPTVRQKAHECICVIVFALGIAAGAAIAMWVMPPS
jgi:hypothetical protein